MMEEIVTADLAKFGWRERHIARELLTAWEAQGLPKGFYDDKVVIMLNTYSGCVFLTNEGCDVAMMNGNHLEMWYSCPECGHEGFLEDMYHDWDNAGCKEYMEAIGLKESVEETEDED